MRPKRQPVVGISLKMYQTTLGKAKPFAERLRRLCGHETGIEQFCCPNIAVMWPVAEILSQSAIGLGTQNMAPALNGAYTGEFSLESLQEMGGKYIEIGHSERRDYFRESDEMIRQKVKLALEQQMIPVLCLGEREQSLTVPQRYQFLYTRLFLALKFLPAKLVSKVIIAYEPVWAIGQRLAASQQHVYDVHQQIRYILELLHNREVAESIRIIYGGSVSQENVEALVAHPDVDGVFVGRFGHEPERYQQIVLSVKRIKGEADD